MFWDFSMLRNANRIIAEGAKGLSDAAFIAHEITRTKTSKEWHWMITGDDYFRGRQDILKKQRTAIGQDGNLEVIHNVPNSRVIDNVYKRMVQQKTNYLLGKPFSINSEDKNYTKILTDLFDKRFKKKLKNVGKDALNCGLGWLYVYCDESGEIQFRRFRPYECIPEWKDIDHTELEGLIRFYDVKAYDGTSDKTITKVEYYTLKGIDFYEYNNGQLIPYEPYHVDYLNVDGKAYNWDKLPIVPFKYNDEEIPLIINCKSLQDGLNKILSNFEDNMEEDSRNTILVLVNYDGQNLGEFRHNLSAYGAVKVRSDEGANGDVKTLQVEVKADNYKAIADIFRRAIIENCMGYDAKDERLGGAPNQMNIQSMYNDIDQDASDMETEFQSAFDDLMYFIDIYLLSAGMGDFTEVEATFTFNTNMPMDEATTIQNIQNSTGIISKETQIAHHPWVTDFEAELKKVKAEEAESMESVYSPFDKDGGKPEDKE